MILVAALAVTTWVLWPWFKSLLPTPPRPKQQPLTAIRIVDLEGRTYGVVRHWYPPQAWAMAADILAGHPRWFAELVA
jgi:hypothetical protein